MALKSSDARTTMIDGFERSTQNMIRRHSKGGRREKLKILRAALGLSQEEFAKRFGLPYATVRNWEQETRGDPSGAAAVLIDLMLEDPETISSLVDRVKRANEPV